MDPENHGVVEENGLSGCHSQGRCEFLVQLHIQRAIAFSPCSDFCHSDESFRHLMARLPVAANVFSLPAV